MSHEHSTWLEAKQTGAYDPLSHWFLGLESGTNGQQKRLDQVPSDTLIPHLLVINKSSLDVTSVEFREELKRLFGEFKSIVDEDLVTEIFGNLIAEEDRENNLFFEIARDKDRVTYPFFLSPRLSPELQRAIVVLLERVRSDYPMLDVDLSSTGMPIDRVSKSDDKAIIPEDPKIPKAYDTIIAVIDVDIAFAHQRFWRSDTNDDGGKQTRIAWFWDQDANPVVVAGDDGIPERASLNTTNLGKQMFADEIDTYIDDFDQGASERALYADYVKQNYTGSNVPLPPSVYAHGTHVLDVAAGGEGDTIDDTTGIFAVQLPREAVAETRGVSSLTPYLLAALERIDTYADEVGAGGNRPRVLVNISVGGHAGRHDGFTVVEQHLDYMIETGKLDGVFVSAGNSFGTQTHARFKACELRDGGASVKWRILPDDGTASFLEIWLPESIATSQIVTRAAQDYPLRLWITPPGGAQKQFDFDDLKPGQYFEFADLDEAAGVTLADLTENKTVLARLYVEDDMGLDLSQSVAQKRPRRRIVLAVRHTQPQTTATGGYVGGRKDLIGDWDIRLEAAASLHDDQIIGLWLYRDEEIVRQNNGARQSFFVPASDDGMNPITDEGTLSDLASGRLTSVISAHVAANRSPTDYSSEGIDMTNSVTSRDVHPSASAVAEQSSAHRGLLAAGFFSGSTWRLGGTSVSSPLALRTVKEVLPNHRLLNSAKSVLTHVANQHEAKVPMSKVESSRIGQGRLNQSEIAQLYLHRRKDSS